ncbi:short-chain dehydrogenase/reductase SDR [Luminiphilus syltensis NOR5-1B]|uniref:Short-chain dehydrogenase/reductase SDR n=1 Tax=Luminiphilus syltensis NOR5-1B TaxID=565045 RepID=B8KSN3_9GAMM|nr:SDR family oxidoreductase [Luminiphilus syltensis]EED34798.1 short-chain dehydrogenase/reductase SDR [Luminiphilus syltensis NOR5-1B]
MGLLEGKVVVVLGASDERSMGAAAARYCLESGAQVVVASRSGEKVAALAKNLGCAAFTCDITSDEQLEGLASFAVEQFGQLDVALNFAGVEAGGAIAELTRDAVMHSADVHLAGTVMFIRFMAEKMSDGGAIVTTSSQTALLAPPGLAAYAGAKAGADHVVRIAANEYGARGIRVNAVAPGFTPSAMTEAYLQMPTVEKAFKKEIALPRLASVLDIAKAAAWLASDDCFATGVVLDVSAGQTLRRIPTVDEMMGEG